MNDMMIAAAKDALDTLLFNVIPRDGYDDAECWTHSIALLREALGDTKQLPMCVAREIERQEKRALAKARTLKKRALPR